VCEAFFSNAASGHSNSTYVRRTDVGTSTYVRKPPVLRSRMIIPDPDLNPDLKKLSEKSGS
jgi:hypothetical protein